MTGRELRGCWTERPAASAITGRPAAGAPPLVVHRLRRGSSADGPPGRPPGRDFVPVEDLPPGSERLSVNPEAWETRTSLFGDLER